MTNTSEEDAETLAERLRKNIETRDFGIEKSITVSGGLKGFADETPEELISLADQALYKAKEEGRNRIIRMQCEIPKK